MLKRKYQERRKPKKYLLMTHSKHDLELPKTMSYAQMTHLRELKNETNSDA